MNGVGDGVDEVVGQPTAAQQQVGHGEGGACGDAVVGGGGDARGKVRVGGDIGHHFGGVGEVDEADLPCLGQVGDGGGGKPGEREHRIDVALGECFGGRGLVEPDLLHLQAGLFDDLRDGELGTRIHLTHGHAKTVQVGQGTDRGLSEYHQVHEAVVKTPDSADVVLLGELGGQDRVEVGQAEVGPTFLQQGEVVARGTGLHGFHLGPVETLVEQKGD